MLFAARKLSYNTHFFFHPREKVGRKTPAPLSPASLSYNTHILLSLLHNRYLVPTYMCAGYISIVLVLSLVRGCQAFYYYNTTVLQYYR